MRAIYKKSDFREGTKKSIPKVAATTDGRATYEFFEPSLIAPESQTVGLLLSPQTDNGENIILHLKFAIRKDLMPLVFLDLPTYEYFFGE